MCLRGFALAADEPARNQEEPPVRLKKKVRPEQPNNSPEKKQETPLRKTEAA